MADGGQRRRRKGLHLGRGARVERLGEVWCFRLKDQYERTRDPALIRRLFRVAQECDHGRLSFVEFVYCCLPRTLADEFYASGLVAPCREYDLDYCLIDLESGIRLTRDIREDWGMELEDALQRQKTEASEKEIALLP